MSARFSTVMENLEKSWNLKDPDISPIPILLVHLSFMWDIKILEGHHFQDIQGYKIKLLKVVVTGTTKQDRETSRLPLV